MFDFGSNIQQSMQIVLAYTGRVQFFGVSITEMIVTIIALPWAIYGLQSLWKTFSPVPIEFDTVTGSIYDPDFHDARDDFAVSNFVNGISDSESGAAIGRYRQKQNRKRQINKHY